MERNEIKNIASFCWRISAPGEGSAAPAPVSQPAGGAEVSRVIWGGRLCPRTGAVYQKLCWVSLALPAQALSRRSPGEPARRRAGWLTG